MSFVSKCGEQHDPLQKVAQAWEPGATPAELRASLVWDFVGYLGDVEVTPQQYALALEYFILDTYSGVNSQNGQSLLGTISSFPPEKYSSGFPPEVYPLLQEAALDLARTAFGSYFADQANAFRMQLYDDETI